MTWLMVREVNPGMNFEPPYNQFQVGQVFFGQQDEERPQYYRIHVPWGPETPLLEIDQEVVTVDIEWVLKRTGELFEAQNFTLFDFKCEMELFYLRSRGVSEIEARMMLARAQIPTLWFKIHKNYQDWARAASEWRGQMRITSISFGPNSGLGA